MRVFEAKDKFIGDVKITELKNFHEFLDFMKTLPVIENDEKYIDDCARDFVEVANLFLQYNSEVYVVDNGADPISFQIFNDWEVAND